MTSWVPGFPSVPDPAELIRLMQVQTEALTQLPRTLANLNETIAGLAGTIETARQTVEVARETADTAQRVTSELERIVGELEQPLQALRPGLVRVAAVLDDPVIDTLPDSLQRLQDAVLPLVEALQRTQSRVSSITAGASATLAKLPTPGRPRRRPPGTDDAPGP